MIRSILHKATKNDNTPAVDLSSEVGFFANNTICRMSVGKKCTKADLGGKEFKEVLEDVLPLTGDFQYSDCIPLLRWLDSQSNRRRQAELTEIFFVFLGRFVVEHIERRKNYSALQCEDFVDLLLSLSRGESMEIKITREHIKKIAFDLISATTDTSGGTLEWAMSELLRNPWRGCPGTNLGMSLVQLGLAQLLHCFNWSLPQGITPENLDMSEVYGVTMPRAGHLLAIPTLRLLLELYEPKP
ncbi:cytochrome P450 71AU50 [Cryptomeria japonica]|uniref:cytochrome P450 71AU50 n=1 Tax=Cryptomeria japonica TaxID=3369 RepID=UPI0027DA5659|nr:cytochrome P450 71AU50 [Cryptomeria japonica]